MGTEMSGTFAIFLYICWHQKYYQRKENYRREMSERFYREKHLGFSPNHHPRIASLNRRPKVTTDAECQVHHFGYNGGEGSAFRPVKPRLAQASSCTQLIASNSNHVQHSSPSNRFSTLSRTPNHVCPPQHHEGCPALLTASRSAENCNAITTTASLHYFNPVGQTRLPNSVTMSTTADMTSDASSPVASGNASRTSTLKRHQETNTDLPRAPMRKVKSVDRATNTLERGLGSSNPLLSDQPHFSRSTSVDTEEDSSFTRESCADHVSAWRKGTKKITTIV